MALTRNYDIADILKQGLLVRIKQTFTEQVVQKELDEFEKRLRETVKPIVEGITIEQIDHIKDVLSMTEDLHIKLHWKDEPFNKKD
ncbi:MAG: hypothetical protein OEX12_11535 [Gammaproteobacteria bacterium]|nr:hypothetical protein [Gammaproteobacteria bacterium]